ncbi:MAG TPA: hypothetical protein VMP68_08900 [Candidatus Eisenbacteria bacterium]|nr:hypothetical protein [Candidatus Eisenbacteria bacterium]
MRFVKDLGASRYVNVDYVTQFVLQLQGSGERQGQYAVRAETPTATGGSSPILAYFTDEESALIGIKNFVGEDDVEVMEGNA